MTKTERIAIRTTKGLKDRLLEIAEKEKRTLSNLCEIVLENYTDKYKEKK